jgi:hypothetical protein
VERERERRKWNERRRSRKEGGDLKEKWITTVAGRGKAR